MKILGTGSALPERIVTNDELSAYLDTSDAWIVPRTGIRSRHIVTDERLEELAAEAAEKALNDAGLAPQDIDYFLCSNIIDEYPTPSLSCLVSARLGMKCPCVDINCACPGFVYALDIAECRYQAGKARNILIVCAEETTRMCNWNDRATSVLFGDGAGAVVLGPGENVGPIHLVSRPAPELLWERTHLMPTPFLSREEQDTGLQMNGREIFRFAVESASEGVETVLKASGRDRSEVDYYLIHQANLRIIEAIQKELGEPIEKFPTNIESLGNTSSASCTILLDQCHRQGLFYPGDILVFSSFGAGLLAGTALVQW